MRIEKPIELYLFASAIISISISLGAVVVGKIDGSLIVNIILFLIVSLIYSLPIVAFYMRNQISLVGGNIPTKGIGATIVAVLGSSVFLVGSIYMLIVYLP